MSEVKKPEKGIEKKNIASVENSENVTIVQNIVHIHLHDYKAAQEFVSAFKGWVQQGNFHADRLSVHIHRDDEFDEKVRGGSVSYNWTRDDKGSPIFGGAFIVIPPKEPYVLRLNAGNKTVFPYLKMDVYEYIDLDINQQEIDLHVLYIDLDNINQQEIEFHVLVTFDPEESQSGRIQVRIKDAYRGRVPIVKKLLESFLAIDESGEVVLWDLKKDERFLTFKWDKKPPEHIKQVKTQIKYLGMLEEIEKHFGVTFKLPDPDDKKKDDIETNELFGPEYIRRLLEKIKKLLHVTFKLPDPDNIIQKDDIEHTLFLYGYATNKWILPMSLSMNLPAENMKTIKGKKLEVTGILPPQTIELFGAQISLPEMELVCRPSKIVKKERVDDRNVRVVLRLNPGDYITVRPLDNKTE